jgi:hypothetical protein
VSDAYGAILASQSSDCEIDGDRLVEALNDYEEWAANSDVKWVYKVTDKDKQLIYFDSGDPWLVQYPSVNVTQLSHVIMHSKGSEPKRIVAEDATEEEFDNAAEWEFAQVPLSQISEEISPHIQKGWFEVACCSNEKARNVEFMRLRVHAGGLVEKLHIYSSPFDGCKTSMESFDKKTGVTRIDGDDGREEFVK